MPIAVTAAEVTNVAKEFAQEDPARIDMFIEFARLFICESVWGSKAKFAIIYYAAHLLKMSQIAESGGAGPITSESVGELSRSYGTDASSESGDLSQTTYGQMIRGLRKTILFTPMVV